MSRIALFLTAALLTPLAAAPAFAQAVSQVRFPAGATGTTVTDRIVGRQYKDYRIGLRAGQMLKVSLTRTRGSAYFNVIEPGAGDVAIYVGSTSGDNFEARASKSGAYTVRVYQMRATGRRGEVAAYRLAMSATGSGGAAAANHPYVPSHKTGDAMVAGTPYHASAPVKCRVDSSGRWGECKAGVVRRSNSSATVHLDTIDGGERTILFRDGRAVSSDAEGHFSVTRRGDTSIIQIGQYETYEIPDALPFGG